MSLIKHARLTSRVVAGGATAALAAAALVGATGSAAQAAPVSTTYSCVGTGAGAGQTFNVPVAVDISLLPTAVAGLPVPAGAFGFISTLTVPNPPASDLNALGVTGGKSDDFAAAFGDTVVKAPVVWDTKTTNPDTSVTYSGKGANTAFALPKAGTYTVSMPKAFTLTTTGGALTVGANCTSASPAQLGTIKLTKQTSKVKATATPKSAEKGAVVSVKGKVVSQFKSEVTGKVIVKDGKKKVGTAKINKKGKFVAKIKGLAVGSHSLTVTFKGDDYSDKSVSKALKVTVTS